MPTEGGGRIEDIRHTAPICRGGGVLSGIGDRTAHTIWTEDHVQRNRWKPKMHSAQKKVLDGIPMEEAECLEPLLTSIPDAPLDSKPMAGNMIRNSSDLAVPQIDQTGRPMEGVTSPALSRRSVTQLHLDSQPSSYQSQPDRSIYPMSDDIPHRQAEPPGNQTVPDVVVQNDTPGRKVCFHENHTVSYGNKNNAVQTAPS